jgi:hypothetical protein
LRKKLVCVSLVRPRLFPQIRSISLGIRMISGEHLGHVIIVEQ